jgi:hypothetical protein
MIVEDSACILSEEALTIAQFIEGVEELLWLPGDFLDSQNTALVGNVFPSYLSS